MSDLNDISREACWYVVHTYSGYENKVKANLEKIVENRGLQHLIFDSIIPVETVQEVGDILDDYHEEATEDDKRGILDLFTKLTEELMSEGFLGDLMGRMAETENTVKPQDRKKKQK